MQQRKRLRLRGYDYGTPGGYLVTVVACQGLCLFGEVVGHAVELSPIGELVHLAMEGIGTFHHGVELDTFVVMPNHVHAIVFLDGRRGPPPVPAVVGAFKARASRRADRALWQRGYHDRIIRSENELTAFRDYIETNPFGGRSIARTPAADNNPRGPDEIRPLRLIATPANPQARRGGRALARSPEPRQPQDRARSRSCAAAGRPGPGRGGETRPLHVSASIRRCR
jgi:putative transposase